MEQNKKLGIEIKEDIEQQLKVKVYENNLLSLLEIVDINNLQPLYCNSTNTCFYNNQYITYISKCIYSNSLRYSMLMAKANEFVITYNINNIRQPEMVYLTIKPLVTIELEKGYLFINKLLDNVEML